MTSLVPKILSWTLKGLNNKQSLRDIIISWNQDNFRFLVEDILESWWDVNDAIDEIKKINRYNNKIYLDLLADTAFEKAENISRYAEVFISMVENWLIDKDNEKISKWWEIAFKKAEYNSDFAKIFISMLEKCLIDKDNENISRLWEIAFKKAEHDLDYAKIYISMLEKWLIDKDNENISKLWEIAFKKAENDSDYAEVLISMLDKWLIDKDNENISKWWNIAIEKSENSLRYAKIYISMVENWLIEKDNEKISILWEIAFEKLRYAELLISMLEKWLIDKDNENISRLWGIAFKKAENDSDYADIYILMLEKWLIKKDNENISRLWEISFKKSENSLGYAKIYISMLDKELIKKDNENISKWWNIAIEGAEGNPVYAKIFISMLEKWLIEKDNENISRLWEIAFKKAENSLGYAKIFISMLEKWLIDKDNENISKWWDIAIEKAENDSDYAKMFISMLEKWLIDKDNEKIYIDEYKEIEESLLSVENNKIKLFNFLNKNIFNYDLLQEIKDFLKNENYFKIDKDFFINNIEKITKNKNWIYFWYFVESIKNGKKIEEKDVLTFPITLANFTDYVDDENEALFHLEKDSWVKFKWIKAWTKAWFLEDESRKNYLTKKWYDYLIKKSVNLSKEEKQEYLSKKWLDKLPKGEKYPKKMIEKYVNVKIDDLIKFNIISNNTENVIYNFLSKNIESFDKIIEFIFTEIKDSKHNTFVFTENKIKASRQFNYIFKYFLENKQKQIVSFLQKLSFIEEYDIWVNITKLKTLDDFKDKTWDLEVEKLRTNYIKILDIISAKSKDKKIKQLENAIKRKDEKWLEKLLAENMIDYFDYIFHKKNENQNSFWF